MPLSKGYAVLKCQAVDSRMEGNEDASPHYQVHVKADNQNYRLAINVKSVQAPFDLLYFVDDNFKHPITELLTKLNFGLHKVNKSEAKAGGLALDYIRANLFEVTKMKPLPFDLPGQDNDLNEVIDLFIKRAINSQDAILYAFGEPWEPVNKPEKIFKFTPDQGVHNLHMNQGSSGKFSKDNGVYQDGGLIIHFPSRNQWVGAFFAFQSQSFHTDDISGNPLPDVPGQPHPLPLPDPGPGIPPTPVPLPDGKVRIIAALVNPSGDDVGKESVTLINPSPDTVDLTGWSLADRIKRKHILENISLKPGAFVTVSLTGKDIQLGNDGGIITLLDQQGTKIHGVSYTKDEVNKSGWTTIF